MATKTNSLVGRLTAIELPAVDDVADGLENHLRTVESVEKLNEELVISYAIVNDGDAKHKREQIETDLIGAHWLVTEAAPWDQF
ncbi:hypothetical protein [Halorubrum lacusprofundi]|jgi:hypothetical protein|uniref:Uncharacterized protein n=1 Tax=Halorubrum lacusprofundi (strain ATCC 49239 / DSM 5036 / JCM 8891 / ACAM 34) TaxID=416348 RepID=B9LP88_HALLT|nr:hypothetical protein [Halorubrum lacusprofundi]ACM57176.1 hypothetical protein Hlac_1590 [Halorubrum lacusprofundi ATCC 49239]MCG1007299.1 hypothetical protein [Halorubrum lacusprofundi]